MGGDEPVSESCVSLHSNTAACSIIMGGDEPVSESLWLPRKKSKSSNEMVDGQPANNDGLIFITGEKPADFKSKNSMTTVRKKAMNSILKGGRKSNKALSLPPLPASSTKARLGVPTSMNGTNQSDSGYFSGHDNQSRIRVPQSLPGISELMSAPVPPEPTHNNSSVAADPDSERALDAQVHDTTKGMHQSAPDAGSVTCSIRDRVEALGLLSNSTSNQQVQYYQQGPTSGGDNMHPLSTDFPELHMLSTCDYTLESSMNLIRDLLPESWRWDVELQTDCWVCTPLEADTPKHFPLTIGGAPVILPVQYQWPPTGGVNPPPDPRPSELIDSRAELGLDVIRDILLTFEGSIGFYVLISGLLQMIVPEGFDTAWASSHLPHKFGGLQVCYIPQMLEATMLPSITETTRMRPSLNAQNSSLSNILRPSRLPTAYSSPTLKLNDFIEARPRANHRKEKYSSRIGLKVNKQGEPYLLMSTHVITEAVLAKSHREAIFGRNRDRFEKLDGDWNEHVEIWAGNERIGTVDKSFDVEAEIYPNGFHHDVTLVKPISPSSVKDVGSPISDLGWLNRESWASLRQNTSAVKILGSTESHRSAKSVKCSRPSEILVVGEGIFLNQTASAGNSKLLKDHDMSTWRNLVSRALLYRVYPDFDPPNGYSGVALYAEGVREDGTEGPGIAGFQSFVQRSGHVQNFNMEGPALERRLQLGRVAFYGAFEVSEVLKREYTIV